jgi:hypothetical protein
MPTQEFGDFYSRRRQALGPAYKDTEFLYPNNEPWPEQSFDYPYGQAPTVSNIPPEEAADWARHVGRYYTENALGTTAHPIPFGFKSAEFARENFAQNGISGYGPVSDELFVRLICEGLYSKYLSRLDVQDRDLFGVQDDADWEYLKSDQGCMRVVTTPWPGEYIAPGIAIVRRRKGATGEARFDYELVAIALARKSSSDAYEYTQDLVFRADRHASTSAWWLAKYFILQGAIHRINLVDHIKVHFPGDTINAITKSVLPRWHLVQQLLLPHFRLTLPVNNTVLEGQRSIINRDTWYPWSPVTARGDVIRRLLPLAWAGNEFYGLERNSSYPKYYFSIDPATVPDPVDPDHGRIETFIGLGASRYGEFLSSYHAPILDFTRKVIALLPDPAPTAAQDGIEWLEIQRWAFEISKLVPGFPDQDGIRSKETLAQICATVIWNAAIVHSSDHSTLHMMIDNYAVPFILRVPPPASNAVVVQEKVKDLVDEKNLQYVTGAIKGLENIVGKAIRQKVEEVIGDRFGKLGQFLGDEAVKVADAVMDSLTKDIGEHELTQGSIPLCWPTDLVYCKMADLLFYRPHNSSLLWDCDYAFFQKQTAAELALEETWREEGLDRPVLSETQRAVLAGIVAQFRDGLKAVNGRYYDNETGLPKQGKPTQAPDTGGVLNEYGFPKLLPGTADLSKDDPHGKVARMECCFAAGVQY